MNTRRSRQSVKPAIAFNIEASTPPSHPEEKKEVARNKVKAPVAFTVGGGTDEHNVTDENTRPSRIPRKRRSTTTPAELQRHNLDNRYGQSCNYFCPYPAYLVYKDLAANIIYTFLILEAENGIIHRLVFLKL